MPCRARTLPKFHILLVLHLFLNYFFTFYIGLQLIYNIVLQIIMLSEISQIEKDNYHMISLVCGIKKMIQICCIFDQKEIFAQIHS